MTAVIYARYSSDNGELKFWDVVVPDAIPPIIPLELFEDV